MKHVSYIIFLLVLLQSCNQTVVDFGTIPYEEKIVVDGLITAQTPLQITFSRTMPALTNVISKQPYDTTSFRLTNVSATVTTNTGDSAILHHVRQGKYVALKPNGDTLIVQQGTTYNLSASWNGKQITAHTTVPMIPELDRFSIFEFNKRSYKNGDTVSQYETYWTCSAKCPYSALFYFTYKVQKSNDLTVLDVLKDTLSSVTIYRFIDEYSQSKIKGLESIRQNTGWGNFGTTKESLDSICLSMNSFFVVHGFDIPFYDYYTTRRNGNGSEGVFSSGGTNIKWNIQGDGIGLFCGRLIYIEKIKWLL